MRKVYLVRHGKTDANRLTRTAFGKAGAPLNAEGQQQAGRVGEQLRAIGLNSDEPVAVSELLRTQETATGAGFSKFRVDSALNEVNTGNPQRTEELIKQGMLPKEAIEKAMRLLESPPEEQLWFTHGLLIAAVRLAVNPNEGLYIPDFGEIVEVII